MANDYLPVPFHGVPWTNLCSTYEKGAESTQSTTFALVHPKMFAILKFHVNVTFPRT